MIYTDSLVFGPFAENTWLVWNDQRQCWIIDPGCYGHAEEQQLKQRIEELGLNPVALLNTHAHVDHVLGNAFVSRTWNLQPHLHPFDLPLYERTESYATVWGIQVPTLPLPLLDLLPNTSWNLSDEPVELRFTPGHTPGEISLVFHQAKLVIAGDVLFRGSIGRTDLPGGDYATLIQSIRSELLTLPDDYRVCCGHGSETTIGHERRSNPFLQ